VSYVHIDVAEVEAVLNQSRAALQGIACQPGSMGAQARMSIAVDHAFARQLATEINTGTEMEHVSDALAAVCTNMMRSLVDSCLPDGASAAMVRHFMMRQLHKQTELIERNLAGDCEGPSYEVTAQTGGRA
jgi:hypothetical protein